MTQKIIQSAKRIDGSSNEILQLGRLDIVRDWGWAPDYVEAMWLMLQQEKPQDFLIATGESFALQDFVSAAFEHLGLNWVDHVQQSDQLFRPTDIAVSAANSSKARQELAWVPKFNMLGVVKNMIEEQLY